MNPKELREKRAALVKQARTIIEKADTEKRAITTEERGQYDTMFAEIASLKDEIDRREKQDALEREMASANPPVVGPMLASDGDPAAAGRAGAPRVVELRRSVCGDERRVTIPDEKTAAERRAMFCRFLRGGTRALTETEVRALQADSDTGGGFLVPPTQFMAELIQAVDDETFVRQNARVLPPLAQADSLGAPSLDSDPADPTWTTEIATGAEDTAMKFGKRELRPYPLAQRIKISKTLVMRAALPVDQIVRTRLAYKAGIVQENAFLNGSGARQPLGVFTASADGIPSGTPAAGGRDVSDGNTNTELRFGGLMAAKYALKAQYRRAARWAFHRDGIAQIATLKDGMGRFLWSESVRVGEPDRILGLPVDESEHVPAVFTGGKYVGILADWRQYWIVDALSMQIQVLTELYAETNQVGYIARLETDGMPVLAEAFVRVTLTGP